MNTLMEKMEGETHSLRLPLHIAVRKHTCQVRTQREIMRMEFQFKVFMYARCRRGVRRPLTRSLLRIVSFYPPPVRGKKDLTSHLSCFLIGHRGAKTAIVCYAALLFTDTRGKHFPHVYDMCAHLTPAYHHPPDT